MRLIKNFKKIVKREENKKGEVITRENIRSIGPGYGLPSKHMEEILEKKPHWVGGRLNKCPLRIGA
jgi:sialic acid synthase SpsE